MKLDVTDILNGRCSTLDFEYSENAGESLCAMLPAGVTVLPDGIFVSGRVSDTGGYISLTADVTVDYTVPCDRCLDETDFYLEFTFERVISAAASPEARERIIDENEEEWDGVTDDLIYVSNGCIDFTDDLSEAITLEFPLRHLCSDDCKGLCPICGKKISEDHPGCTPKKEIDPRLAVLQKLLDNSEKNN